MNYPNPLHLSEASNRGPAFFTTGDSSDHEFYSNGVPRYRWLSMLPLCACVMISTYSHAADDITSDSIQSGDSSIAALSYSDAADIGTIKAMLSATTTNGSNAWGVSASGALHIAAIGENAVISANSAGHYAYGVSSSGNLLIDSFADGAVITAESARNYAYGIHSSGGDITFSEPIAGGINVILNKTNKAASANGYGIYTKSGDITMAGLAGSASITVTTPQSATSGRFYGIVTESGNIAINGAVAGTIRTVAPGSISYGIWAKKGTIGIDSIASAGSIDVTSTFNAYGVYSSVKDITIGDIDGDINARATTGNFAYGVRASGLTDTDRSHVNIGRINGTVSADAAGQEGNAIMADYGFLTVGDINGTVSASVGTNNAYALAAKYDLTVGNIGRDAVIAALAGGSDAYAIHAGYSKASFDTVLINKLTVGHIEGKVTASASTGRASALFARSDLTIGHVSDEAMISAVSDASATTTAIWTAAGRIRTGVIDGSVVSQSAQGDAYGIVGLGLDIEVGSHGSISAQGSNSWAVYSGCYQGNSYRSYNLPDTITLHAGSSIAGAIELGGSGSEGHDQINLQGGDDSKRGLLDAPVLTTINTTNQNESTRKSDVRIAVGTSAGDRADWILRDQTLALTGLTVNRNATLEMSAGPISLKDGGFIENAGRITGSGVLRVTAGSSITTGYLATDGGTGLLVTGSTGIDPGITLSIEEGASLGTIVLNETQGLMIIRQEDIRPATTALYEELSGATINPDHHRYSYSLRGNLAFADQVLVKSDEQYRLGEGSTISLTPDTVLTDDSIVLEGGILDTTASNQSTFTDGQISGMSGLWVASRGQELHINGNKIIGYDTRDANIYIGSDGSAPHATLTGVYETDSVRLQSGEIRLEGGTIRESGNGLVVASTGTTLVNNGTIESDVDIAPEATLKGSGLFAGNVRLGRHARLHVGNSPGRQVYAGNLHLEQGASMTFSIDGARPAVGRETEPGTFSHMIVSGAGHSVTLGGGNIINLDIGAGILNQDTQEFHLVLISYVDAASSDASFNGDNFTTRISGLSDLIESGVTWSFGPDSLVLNGRLNREAVKDTVNPEASRYANALWSSTGIVRSFARTGSSHCGSGVIGKTDFWVDGIGDFMSASRDGSADGFDSNHGGYAFGAQSRFNDSWSGGIAYGQSFGRNNASNGYGKVKQTANMLGLYGRFDRKVNNRHSWHIRASFAYGQAENKADGYFNNDWSNKADAEWDDDVFSFGMTGNWDVKLDKNSTITAFAGLEFINGSQQSFTQSAGSAKARYSGGALQRWIIPVGLTWQGVYAAGSHYLIPEATIAYQGDVSRRDASVGTTVLGQEAKFRGVSPARNAIIANTGLRWVMNDQWSASAYYNLGYASGLTHHSVNAGVTYSF